MKNKRQQNVFKGLVITALVLLTFSCQNATKSNKPAKIKGTTLVKGDKFELKYNTFQISFDYGQLAIEEGGSFNGDIFISEPVFGKGRIVNDRRTVKIFPLYVKPGATAELAIGEKEVEYKGELKAENEFFKKFELEVSMGIFRYYNSTNFDDFTILDRLNDKNKAVLSEVQLDEEFKQYVASWLNYSYQSIKYKIIAKADVTKSDLPTEVINYIKETSSEKFNSSALMGVQDWRIFLDNYFKMQDFYFKNNAAELVDRFKQIENSFMKERYALYLSNKLINSNNGMDGTCRKQVDGLSTFIKSEQIKTNLDSLYIQLSKSELGYKHLLKGKPAPGFTFEDVNGKMVSLSDFKGKYVFLDVWNIYCGPCIAQIPYIKKYEEELKDENIAFVAVSCDRQKEKQKWRDFVVKKEMVGHQLIMDKGRDSEFLMDYNIKGFPTFMVIDPEGNMVDYKFLMPERKEFLPTLLSIIKS
ncbi:TlpA family protein disulfide reductase [Bacteroidota bacterium]